MEPARPPQENFGSGMIRITEVRIAGANSGTHEVAPGETVLLTLCIAAETDEPNLTVGIEIRDPFGEVVFGTNSHLQRTGISVRIGHAYEVTYSFPANLNRGRYLIGGALHTGADHLACCYQWSDKLGELDVVQLGEPDFVGYCRLEPNIAWRDVTLAARERIPSTTAVG
jgi:lipopolysaccharide transport system ATP-binding protein